MLTSSLPITSPMTITGPGPDQLAVTGNSMAQPIFAVNPTVGQTVRLEKLKIADARATSFAGGGIGKGGVGSLELDNVWLFDNFSGQGGAVFVDHGSVNVQNSALNNNHAQFGGAIVSRRDSAMLPPGTLQISNSTLSDNSAMEFGGALNPAEGSTMTILSSTIVGNTANDDNNTTGDGGGIYNNLSTVNVADSILAANSVGTGSSGANGQCAGNAFASAGYNLRSAADPNCTGFTATGDIVEPTPLLVPSAPTAGRRPRSLCSPAAPPSMPGTPWHSAQRSHFVQQLISEACLAAAGPGPATSAPSRFSRHLRRHQVPADRQRRSISRRRSRSARRSSRSARSARSASSAPSGARRPDLA